MWPVTLRINRPDVNDPTLLEPLPESPESELF
jgi:hypothetical protein